MKCAQPELQSCGFIRMMCSCHISPQITKRVSESSLSCIQFPVPAPSSSEPPPPEDPSLVVTFKQRILLRHVWVLYLEFCWSLCLRHGELVVELLLSSSSSSSSRSEHVFRLFCCRSTSSVRSLCSWFCSVDKKNNTLSLNLVSPALQVGHVTRHEPAPQPGRCRSRRSSFAPGRRCWLEKCRLPRHS